MIINLQRWEEELSVMLSEEALTNTGLKRSDLICVTTINNMVVIKKLPNTVIDGKVLFDNCKFLSK